jgi:hypothetical protein
MVPSEKFIHGYASKGNEKLNKKHTIIGIVKVKSHNDLNI